MKQKFYLTRWKPGEKDLWLVAGECLEKDGHEILGMIELEIELKKKVTTTYRDAINKYFDGEIRERILKNCGHLESDCDKPNAAEVLDGAFAWDKSPEGFKLWSMYYNSLIKPENP